MQGSVDSTVALTRARARWGGARRPRGCGRRPRRRRPARAGGHSRGRRASRHPRRHAGTSAPAAARQVDAVPPVDHREAGARRVGAYARAVVSGRTSSGGRGRWLIVVVVLGLAGAAAGAWAGRQVMPEEPAVAVSLAVAGFGLGGLVAMLGLALRALLMRAVRGAPIAGRRCGAGPRHAGHPAGGIRIAAHPRPTLNQSPPHMNRSPQRCLDQRPSPSRCRSPRRAKKPAGIPTRSNPARGATGTDGPGPRTCRVTAARTPPRLAPVTLGSRPLAVGGTSERCRMCRHRVVGYSAIGDALPCSRPAICRRSCSALRPPRRSPASDGTVGSVSVRVGRSRCRRGSTPGP